MHKKILRAFWILPLVGLLLIAAFKLPTTEAEGLRDTAPSLPHAFYGDVTINGSPAPAGTQIEARGTGVQVGQTGNPLTTSVSGRYGGAGGFDPKLVVQGDILPGAAIRFYINGSLAECALPGGSWWGSYAFQSGAVTELDLRIAAEETPTFTPLPTATNTAQPTATNTAQPTATNTAQPTATNTAQPTATNTTQPTATNTTQPTAEITTVVKTATFTPTATRTNTPRPTAASTNTPRPTVTRTNTPRPTATLSPTDQPLTVACDLCEALGVSIYQEIVLIFNRSVNPDEITITIGGTEITDIIWENQNSRAIVSHSGLAPLQSLQVLVIQTIPQQEPVTLLDCSFETDKAYLFLPRISQQ